MHWHLWNRGHMSLCHCVSDPSDIQQKNYVVTGDAYGRNMMTISLYLDLHIPPTISSKSKGPRKDKVIPKSCETVMSCLRRSLLMIMRWNGLHQWIAIWKLVRVFSLTDVESDKGIWAIIYVMLKWINSWHVDDNSCILNVTPKLSSEGFHWFKQLKWCHVESCSKLQAMFRSYQSKLHSYVFPYLKTIWASDLPVATCVFVWSKGSIYDNNWSFETLESIHLHKCPRIKFALLMLRSTYLH